MLQHTLRGRQLTTTAIKGPASRQPRNPPPPTARSFRPSPSELPGPIHQSPVTVKQPFPRHPSPMHSHARPPPNHAAPHSYPFNQPQPPLLFPSP
jgi:hypothetical protein